MWWLAGGKRFSFSWNNEVECCMEIHLRLNNIKLYCPSPVEFFKITILQVFIPIPSNSIIIYSNKASTGNELNERKWSRYHLTHL